MLDEALNKALATKTARRRCTAMIAGANANLGSENRYIAKGCRPADRKGLRQSRSRAPGNPQEFPQAYQESFRGAARQ